MTQVIGSVRIRTSSQPIANVQTGAVRVSVNPGNPQRVQSVNYLAPVPSLDFFVAQAQDVVIENTDGNRSVLTYDNTTSTFKVQNVPNLDGGTY